MNLKEEVVAKGTKREWTKYTPEGCGMFFVNKSLALEWEKAHVALTEKIKKFYNRKDVKKLQQKLEVAIQINSLTISRLSKRLKKKPAKKTIRKSMKDDKALAVYKRHKAEKKGCKCPWCRKGKKLKDEEIERESKAVKEFSKKAEKK